MVEHAQSETTDFENPVNLQLMLYTIKLLAIKLCINHKGVFVGALPTLAQLYSAPATNQLIAINAILCTAELCVHLQSDLLPHLPILINPILEKISSTDSSK